LGSERDRGEAALRAKYGLQYRLFAWTACLRGASGNQVILRFDLC
jgi:hypothetical protein